MAEHKQKIYVVEGGGWNYWGFTILLITASKEKANRLRAKVLKHNKTSFDYVLIEERELEVPKNVV